MGLAEEFLSIRIRQKPGDISIDQELYVNELLDKYSVYVGRRNYADIPSMNEYMPRTAHACTPKQQAFVEAFPYSALVGSLLYLAVVTRIDIMYAVGVLTRHLKAPTYASCKAACRVLNYLSSNRSKCLRYRGSKIHLHAFTDSDWASDKDTRRSTSGNIVLMAGAPVNWLSKLQAIVTVSSMEAEYIACFLVVQDVIWIRQLLSDLGIARSRPTPVYIDNMSARQLAINPVHHQRSKHIDVKFHWLLNAVSDESVILIHVDTTEQRADFLTKTLSGLVFHRHVDRVMESS